MRKIRIGFLLDDLTYSTELKKIISNLNKNKEIELVLVFTRIENHDSILQLESDCVGFRHKFRHVLLETILRIERGLLIRNERINYFEGNSKSLKNNKNKSREENFVTSDIENFKIETMDDVRSINEQNLDVLFVFPLPYRLNCSLLKEIKCHIVTLQKNVERNGIIEGFWEVYSKEPSTTYRTIIYTNDNNKILVYPSHFKTKTTYLQNKAEIDRLSLILFIHIIDYYVDNLTFPNNHDPNPTNIVEISIPGTFESLKYGSYIFATSLKKIVNSKISKGRRYRWSVGLMRGNWETADLSTVEEIPNPPGRFFADPFVIEFKGKTAVFVEDYEFESGKATISAIEILSDGSHRYFNHVIEENYHLSFPFVFFHDEDLYMVPECHQSGSIRLYKCQEFPNKWAFVRDILKGINAVDSIIFYQSDKWWLLTNTIVPGSTVRYLECYYSDDLFGDCWLPHDSNPLCTSSDHSRNGGLLRSDDGGLFRVRQKQGFGKYGDHSQLQKS